MSLIYEKLKRLCTPNTLFTGSIYHAYASSRRDQSAYHAVQKYDGPENFKNWSLDNDHSHLGEVYVCYGLPVYKILRL